MAAVSTGVHGEDESASLSMHVMYLPHAAVAARGLGCTHPCEHVSISHLDGHNLARHGAWGGVGCIAHACSTDACEFEAPRVLASMADKTMYARPIARRSHIYVEGHQDVFATHGRTSVNNYRAHEIQ